MNNEPNSNKPNNSSQNTQPSTYLTPEPKIKNSQPTAPAPTSEPSLVQTKTNPAPLFLAAFLLVISAIATIISVVKIVEAKHIQDLRKAELASLELNNAIIKRISESTGLNIAKPDDVPDYIPLKNKLYLNAWGVSLELPDSIINLSYTLNFNENRICFNAAKSGSTFMPDFTNPVKNPNGIGCMIRLSLDKGLKDFNTGAAHGELVATFDDFNYFYVAPKEKFSKAKVEQDLEESATVEIKKMILAGPKKY